MTFENALQYPDQTRYVLVSQGTIIPEEKKNRSAFTTSKGINNSRQYFTARLLVIVSGHVRLWFMNSTCISRPHTCTHLHGIYEALPLVSFLRATDRQRCTQLRNLRVGNVWSVNCEQRPFVSFPRKCVCKSFYFAWKTQTTRPNGPKVAQR